MMSIMTSTMPSAARYLPKMISRSRRGWVSSISMVPRCFSSASRRMVSSGERNMMSNPQKTRYGLSSVSSKSGTEA